MATAKICKRDVTDDTFVYENASRNPLDLLETCRRVMCEWQYMDSTAKQSRLVEVEKDIPLFRDARLRTKSGSEIVIPRSEQEGLKCTKLTISDNFKLHEVRELRTLKNFRGEGLDLPYKDLESYHWILRLQGRSEILPIAIINMARLLKQVGFTGWNLPNGEVIPFEALKTGNLEVSPRHKYIHRSIMRIGDYLHEDEVKPFRCKDYEFGVGPVVHHCILVTTLRSGKRYVFDPASMSFNMKGPLNTLIMHGEWEDYKELFPGKIVRKSFDNWEELFKQQLYSANNPMDLITKIENRILRYIDRRTCDRCGEFDGTRNEIPIPAMFYPPSETKLRCCPICKKGKYCDDICQAMDFQHHKAECIPYNVNN